MDDYFDVSQKEIRAQERTKFLNNWRKAEKFSERVGGILLIFAAGFLISWEKPSDEYTLMAVAGLLTCGIYLLLVYSRRPDDKRTALHFLLYDSQIRYAWMAGMGAVSLVMDIIRPLQVVAAGLLVIFALWFRWRAYQINHFDKLFVNNSEDETAS